jgi:ankyrin repeat protein
VNHADKNGDTALMSASKKGHADIVQLLLTQEAKVNHSNRYGMTALVLASWASNHRHADIVQLLVAKGASANHDVYPE